MRQASPTLSFSVEKRGGLEKTTLARAYAVWSSVVPLLVAAILIAAALLKASRLWLGTLPGSGWPDSVPFRLVLIELELALGLALAFLLNPRLTRLIALLLFCIFLAINLFEALAGARTCACFGIDIHPWFTAGLDAGILAVLWSWRPVQKRPESWPCPRFTSFSLLSLLVVPIALTGILASQAYPIQTPDRVDLGPIAQGSNHAFPVSVRNILDKELTITHVETTCPCVKARDLPLRLMAREEKELPMRIELSREPAFVGDLVIGLDGQTQLGTKVFEVVVRATVVARESNDSNE